MRNNLSVNIRSCIVVIAARLASATLAAALLAVPFVAVAQAAAPAAPAADPHSRPAILAGGRTLMGQLVTADAEGRLTFRVQGADRTSTNETIPAAQLVRWGQFVESTRGPQILLADGGLLVAQLAAIDGQQLAVKSDLFGDVTLPTGAVLAVLVHPPADPHRRDQLIGRLLAGDRRPEQSQPDGNGTVRNDAAADPITAGTEALDRILLDNGDELVGTAAAWHDDMLTVETDAGRVDIEAAQITAIQFRRQPTGSAAPPARRLLIVGWRDGSRLCAASLVADATRARLTLAGTASSGIGSTGSAPAGGAENAAAAPAVASPPPITLSAETSAITALQTLGGQAIYLSDLEAVGYKHIPFLELAWPYQTDHNVGGDLLRAGGRLFHKGLGMHSASRLTYDLDRPASRFEAALAIDDAASGRGSVVFRVFVDTGDGHWEPKFTSPIVRGGDPPLPITVDLARAKRISLLVEFADRGDQLDYADWLDARLIP